MDDCQVIDVIIPVYAGYEQTKQCIESVITTKALNSPFNIVVVNDCSPEREIHRYLQQLALDGVIQLLVNESNLGFVATVNKAMRLNVNRDVVLLNSDTRVANNWLDRLVKSARSAEKIATVTPFSNNAEICSFPRYCASNDLIADLEFIDKVFSSLPADIIDVPTGVGFCMYIARDALDEIGYFNEEVFGRGYGEENDFCQRALKQGWRNVTCTNVFVFHEGGVSFSAEKAERVNRAMKLLDDLYPNYHADVQKHIKNDPEKYYRNLAQIKLIQQDSRPRVLAVVHGLGGGVIKHVDELGESLSAKMMQLTLKPVSPGYLELAYTDNGFHLSLLFHRANELEELIEFLQAISISRIHWHHTMGYALAEIDRLRTMGLPMWATIHDYYWIGGNPTLTGVDGRFVDDINARDERCLAAYPLPDDISLEKWRNYFNGLLGACELCLAPSNISAQEMLNYYPQLPMKVAYHIDWEQYSPFPTPRLPKLTADEKLRVLVIGAMSREKGADVLEGTATYKDQLNRLEYHLLGYAYKPLAEEVITYGPYQDSELLDKIKDLDPHLVWFPAQWNETYCYVLTTVLRAGLPVLSTDLGAFKERLANRPLSFVLPWASSPQQWNDTLLQIRDLLLAMQTQDSAGLDWLQDQQTSFRYLRDYCDKLTVFTASSTINYELVKKWTQAERALDSEHKFRELVLQVLWHCRQMPVLRTISRLVPFRVQRALKRKLSNKPIHDLV